MNFCMVFHPSVLLLFSFCIAEKFLAMITLAESNTDALFYEVYKIPLLERREPLQNLFLDLRAYISKLNVTVDVQDSVTEFFDEIFPLVFRHILNSLGDKELSEDYKLCLMEVHKKELHKQPFGDFPKRLAHSLSKSLGSAREFLQAVSLAVEVIDKTDHYKLEHRCSKALTKLEFCGQCQGYPGIKPCRPYCQNVMRGCLAHITTLDSVWNNFADTLDTMTSNMRGTYSIEAVMRTFHMHISDAIMNALDAGPKFYPKVCIGFHLQTNLHVLLVSNWHVKVVPGIPAQHTLLSHLPISGVSDSSESKQDEHNNYKDDQKKSSEKNSFMKKLTWKL